MPSTRDGGQILGSWKEIAAYLGKGVRTVQRWEQQFGLPVSRPKKAAKGLVIASPERLDEWLETQWAERTQRSSRKNAADSVLANDVAASVRDFRRLRQMNRALADDVKRATDNLKRQYEELVRNVSHSSETEKAVVENPLYSADRKRSGK